MRQLIAFALAPFFAGFCWLGGSSSSSSDQITSQTDARVSGGHGGAQVSGDGNTVNVLATDQGAVMAGLEATRGALQTAERATDAMQGVFGQAVGAVEKAYAKGNAGDQRMAGFVALAAVAMVAFFSFGKAR